jgi:hypothetical protein
MEEEVNTIKQPARLSDPAFVQQLWAERFAFPIPDGQFVNTWSGCKSMFVITAFKDAARFYRRLPSKTAMDIAKLITVTISRSRVIQQAKLRAQQSQSQKKDSNGRHNSTTNTRG